MKHFWEGLFFCSMLPLLCLLIFMPFRLLYWVADGCFFIIYYLIRYRRKIVANNLLHAFPTATERELKDLEKDFYHHFCDLLVEYIKSLTLSPKQLADRCRVENPRLWENYYKAGTDLLLATAHQGNWEWAGYAVALQTKYKLAVVYKPLSNAYFDALVAKLRTRFSRLIIPERKVLRTLLAPKTYLQATALLADQLPRAKHVLQTEFLYRMSDMDLGLGKLACRLNIPLLYVHVKKVKRGYYRLEAEVLIENPRVSTPAAITELYTRYLEKMIKEQPSTWLWSHNRWKRRT